VESSISVCSRKYERCRFKSSDSTKLLPQIQLRHTPHLSSSARSQIT
jgi:hypothetical protein